MDSENLKAYGKVITFFCSPTCKPCQALEVILRRSKYPMLKIDITEDPKAAIKYKVLSVPTVIIFKGGKKVSENITGMKPLSYYESFI